jgi:hypothetical protein
MPMIPMFKRPDKTSDRRHWTDSTRRRVVRSRDVRGSIPDGLLTDSRFPENEVVHLHERYRSASHGFMCVRLGTREDSVKSRSDGEDAAQLLPVGERVHSAIGELEAGAGDEVHDRA